jgi:mannose-6-phosphate isomerase-like protein (cupin superfamily)
MTRSKALTTGGSPFWFLDSLLAIRADSAVTAGQFGMSESWAREGHGSPFHVHSREDEGFFVIEGEMKFWFGDDEPFTLGSGGLAWLPRSTPHGFLVTSPTARFLTITTPAGFEEHFRLNGKVATEQVIPTRQLERADIEHAGATLKQLGVTVLGPLPA